MGYNRDIYFAKHCEGASSVKEYIIALQKSPFRTHQRMAKALIPELKKLIEEQKLLADDIKEGVNNEA